MARGLGELLLETGAIGVGRGSFVTGDADQGLDLAGDHRQATVLHRPVERFPSQVSLQRPRASEPLDRGAEPLERRPQAHRHDDPDGKPAGRLDPGFGPGVAKPADELDERIDLGLRVEVPLPHSGPAGDDEQVRVRRSVRQRAPELLGDERHHGMEKAQVGVEGFDERPPGRLPDLGREAIVGEPHLRELKTPVAEL